MSIVKKTKKNKLKNLQKTRGNYKNQTVNLHIWCGKNNTMVNITNDLGQTQQQFSAGKLAFKGAQKKTEVAIKTLWEKVADWCKYNRVGNCAIIIKGCGAAFNLLDKLFAQGFNFQIESIEYRSSLPYGGTRARKIRRT